MARGVEWVSVPAGPALGGAAAVVAVAAALLAAYLAAPIGKPVLEPSWERSAWGAAAALAAASLPPLIGYVCGFWSLGGEGFDARGRAREALGTLTREAALEGGELALPEGHGAPGPLRGGREGRPAWEAPAVRLLACGLRALSLVDPAVRAGVVAAMAFLVMMLGLVINSMFGGHGSAVNVFVGACMLTVFAGFATLVLAVFAHLAAAAARYALGSLLRS